ncbi:uncharacterized protein JCM6883_000877 [Sporobolomyces salmoneus]|uniref:uncharacterized protein n=1 Tax=Sporobolomyces salmoneus TaxID=183962 RepID=UPI00316B3B34
MEPSIVTKTFSLELEHPGIPYPLTLIVNQLSPSSIMLFISTPPASQSSIMKDTSVAMPNRLQNFACPSTSLSKSTSSSLSLASRLAKRYNIQIFVSLDLDQLAETAGPGVTKESMMLFVEKSLLKQLDQILPRSAKK